MTSLADLSGLTALDLRKSSASLGQAVEAGADDPLVVLALGATFLQLGQHERAAGHFSRVIDQAPGESEAYFYSAIAGLGGRRPFLSPLAKIAAIESQLDAAIQIEPRGVYWALRAYVVADYYERKGLRPPITSTQCSEEARLAGFSVTEAQQLANLVNAPSPDFFETLQ